MPSVEWKAIQAKMCTVANIRKYGYYKKSQELDANVPATIEGPDSNSTHDAQ